MNQKNYLSSSYRNGRDHDGITEFVSKCAGYEGVICRRLQNSFNSIGKNYIICKDYSYLSHPYDVCITNDNNGWFCRIEIERLQANNVWKSDKNFPNGFHCVSHLNRKVTKESDFDIFLKVDHNITPGNFWAYTNKFLMQGIQSNQIVLKKNAAKFNYVKTDEDRWAIPFKMFENNDDAIVKDRNGFIKMILKFLE